MPLSHPTAPQRSLELKSGCIAQIGSFYLKRGQEIPGPTPLPGCLTSYSDVTPMEAGRPPGPRGGSLEPCDQRAPRGGVPLSDDHVLGAVPTQLSIQALPCPSWSPSAHRAAGGTPKSTVRPKPGHGGSQGVASRDPTPLERKQNEEAEPERPAPDQPRPRLHAWSHSPLGLGPVSHTHLVPPPLGLGPAPHLAPPPLSLGPAHSLVPPHLVPPPLAWPRPLYCETEPVFHRSSPPAAPPRRSPPARVRSLTSGGS